MGVKDRVVDETPLEKEEGSYFRTQVGRLLFLSVLVIDPSCSWVCFCCLLTRGHCSLHGRAGRRFESQVIVTNSNRLDSQVSG